MYLIIVVTVVLIGAIAYNQNYKYWKKRNIPYLQPQFPLGNILNPFTYHMKKKTEHFINRFYREMKNRGWKHGGLYFFNVPVYMIIDTEYAKNILVRDFEYFTDRGLFYNEKNEPVSAHLVSLDGEKWKNMRRMLNPLFTPCRMKSLLPFISNSVENLLSKIKEGAPVDMYTLVSCYTLNNIASCIFGLECNMFEEENASFKIHAQNMIKQPTLRIYALIFASVFPSVARALRYSIFPENATNFFRKLIKDCVNYRKKNGYRRDDLIQLLIDLKDTLTIDQITAQCVIFLLSFESTTTTLTFTLYELAKNQEIQNKAREEMGKVLGKYENKMTYEALQDLKYFNQIFDETGRKYPPVWFLTRQCVKDYKIPDEDAIIEKGTMLIIPSASIHYDEEYYPDSEKFDPERFSEANKNSRYGYAHLPFGEGPRICIGKRFALLQLFYGLAALLKNYRFTVNDNMKEPSHLKVYSAALTPIGPVWLDVHKL